MKQPRITKTIAEQVYRPTKNHPGILITVIGFDGSGKTTQISSIGQQFSNHGHEVIVTRQPTDWYRQQPFNRSFLDRGGSPVQARILSLMAAADRLRHVHEVIDPALEQGKVVICDRYVHATFGVFIHRGVDAHFLSMINKGIPRPDYAFYLKLPPDVLIERLKRRDRGDLKFEERSRDRIESVTRTYDEMGSHLITIDGTSPPERVTEAIMSHICIEPPAELKEVDNEH